MSAIDSLDKGVTPGPWVAVCIGSSGSGDNAVGVWDVCTDSPRRYVCHNLHGDDAKFIASAPEMVDALHGLMRAIDSVTQGQEAELRKEWEPKARALLKRLGRTEGLR